MLLTYQKHLASLMFIFSIAVCLYTSSTYAKNNSSKEEQLAVTPLRCVALRQGQICYQGVTFRWHQPEVGNYCLVELSSSDNIKCWSNVKTGEIDFDFQSDRSLTYGIRKIDEKTHLSSVNITVSWVFKSSKRPKASWKLF